MRTGIGTYRGLDVFRFVAAMLVAFGHFDDGFQLKIATVTSLAVRYGLFVDFFFILSGFVIALNYGNRIGSLSQYGDFLWRRVARLWPLHLFVLGGLCLMAFAAWLFGYSFTNAQTYAPDGLLWNAALLHAFGPVWRETFNAASWSISAEFFVYILFPCFAFMGRKHALWINLLLIAAFVALLEMARMKAGIRPWHESTFDLGAFRAVPSFFLGVLIQQQLVLQRDRIIGSWPLACSVFIAAMVAIHIGLPSEVIILMFGVFILLAARAEEVGGQTLFFGPVGEKLGNASYALYMVHLPVMTVMLALIRSRTGLENGWGHVGALVAFTTSVVLAFLLYRFLEVPARNWLNQKSPFAERPSPDRQGGLAEQQ